MSRLILVAAGVAALWSAAPASAQPSAAAHASAIDPAALKAADHLLDAMGYDRMMERTCEAMVTKMAPVMKSEIEEKSGQSVDDAMIKRITDVQLDFMRETLIHSADFRRAVVTVYASHFTAAELGHLAELYKDPVMQKWSEVSPAASAEILPLITQVVDSRRGELEKRIEAAVTDYLAQKQAGPTT